MITQYLVRKIETCPKCDGARLVDNPEWEQLDERCPAEQLPDETPADTFWRLVAETWPAGNEPPEEIVCGECHGEGVIESWVDLRAALQEIGA